MEELKSNLDDVSRTRHDFFYMQLATRYYITHLQISKEFLDPKFHEPIIKLKARIDEEGISHNETEIQKIDPENVLKNYTRKLFNIKSTSHIIIVFSALCLESLINDYCALRKSTKFLKNVIDKLDTPSKWVIVPKIIANKEISTDSKAYELLKELFSLRNELVHPKTKEIEKNSLVKEMIELYFKQTNRSYQAIKEATHELYKLDPQFRYLNDYKWMWNSSEQFKDISEFESLYYTFMGDQKV